jgi:hypothetical protein
MQHKSPAYARLPITDTCRSVVAGVRAAEVTGAAQDRAPDSSTNAKCRTAKLLPYCPLLKPNAHLMNLTSRAGGVMQKKQACIGILLLSLALVPRTVMAELNDGSLSSTGTPVHQEVNTDSDQGFLAAFRAAHLPLLIGFVIAGAAYAIPSLLRRA